MMLELFTMLTASGKEEARALLQQLYSFPDHLPRLSNLRPPDGNARPASIFDSYYEQRQRGELPTTY